MNQALVVEVFQCRRCLLSNGDDPVDRERTIFFHAGSETPALDQFHAEVDVLSPLMQVEYRDDVGVAGPGCPNLSAQTLSGSCVSEVGMEEFDGDPLADRCINRGEDRSGGS